jgi:23S rRNA pseudouridine1911/1915/1917 synthase
VPSRPFTFVVAHEDVGLRIDQLLAKHVPGLSRRTARKLLLIGGVFVERARVKVASKLIQPGRRIDVYMGNALEAVDAAEKVAPPELEILFEDDHLLVVNKPPQLPTAATRETDRHNLLYYLEQRPSSSTTGLHLIHRLDLETSGLLVVAKTKEAAQRLSEDFRTHDVERLYQVVVLGELAQPQSVDEPIEGRPARTDFTPRARKAGMSLVDAILATGRTHQIRVHAQRLGLPVLGDRRYGRSGRHDPPRLALHARVLGFRHPVTGQPMRFEQDWPADLRDWWQAISDEPAGER